jgi:hypothetical protein
MSIPILGRLTRTFLPAIFFPGLPESEAPDSGVPDSALAVEIAFRSFLPFDSSRGEIEIPGTPAISLVS